MPLRDESKYFVTVENEPKEVTEIREKILTSFDGLEFVDEGHKYFLNGKELMPVSTFAGLFESEFNTVEESTKYAKKHGETPEFWADKWRYNNLKATISGTRIHEYAESMAWLHMGHPENITEGNKDKYIADKGWLIPTHPKEESAAAFWEDFLPNTWVVLPETKIYNIGSVYSYAGTFDLLLYYKNPTDDTKSGLIVADWKTNAEIYKSYNRLNGRMLKPPFNTLYDEPYGAYTIQLNLYTIALEKIGLKVLGRRIIWLKEDKSFELIPVNYIGDTIRKLDSNL